MGRRRRMSDEALRVAEIVRDVDQPERVEKAEAALLAAGHVKAHEAAALLHLPAREIVLRMARQPRIEHSRNFGVGFEIARDRRSGAALAIDAELKRLEPFEQQPGVERAE